MLALASASQEGEEISERMENAPGWELPSCPEQGCGTPTPGVPGHLPGGAAPAAPEAPSALLFQPWQRCAGAKAITDEPLQTWCSQHPSLSEIQCTSPCWWVQLLSILLSTLGK